MAENQQKPILSKIVQIAGVLGMFIGASVTAYNHQSFGLALLFTAVIGLVFAFGAKLFIGRWMIYWVEAKLEVASKEKEEAEKLEIAKREELRKLEELQAEKIRAERTAVNTNQSKSET